MHSLKRIRQLIAAPPHKTAAKILKRAKHAAGNAIRRRIDHRHATYSETRDSHDPGLRTFLKSLNVEDVSRGLRDNDLTVLNAFCERYLNHQFNLLGSGWVQVRHDMSCAGLNGSTYDHGQQIIYDSDGEWLREFISSANLAQARSLWKLIDDEKYVPIDWQRDFKSGYRWSESTWYRDIPLGHLPGVDIKVPWELARMQHLPQMAMLYCALPKSPANKANRERLRCEFRNQVLDFLATNPPRFGVNWQCAMDVGIRIANWLLAYDLFLASGGKFDEPFERVFRAAVRDHGHHLISNLEWSRELRGNHYLADIAGLLFVAAYLPCESLSNAWLAYAIQEFVVEVEHQFLPDGGNFEASICYHRLSMEMVIWCTAIVLGLDDEKTSALSKYDHQLVKPAPAPPLKPAPLPVHEGTLFTSGYLNRLKRMTEFLQAVTKPNGNLHQVGDNDSGRFVNLLPRLQSASENSKSLQNDPRENLLQSDACLQAASGLFQCDDLRDQAGGQSLEEVVIRQIVNDHRFEKPSTPLSENGIRVQDAESRISQRVNELKKQPGCSHVERTIVLPEGIDLSDLKMYTFPDFGIYLWRNERVYLAVRCGDIGQNGIGGHAHFDQLAVELQVDGRDWIADPGSFLYTPDPSSRNAYRSVQAHFAPRLANEREPGRLDAGLFRLTGSAGGICEHHSRHGFMGYHLDYGSRVIRIVLLENSEIQIHDFAESGLELAPIPDASAEKPFQGKVPFSAGYGIR